MHARNYALPSPSKLLRARVAHVLLLVLGIALWLPHRASAQTTPSISGISPSPVTAGGPTFNLTVNGSGFKTNSVVQINGSSRPTVFKSALLLTATVFASDLATPSTLQITVFNPFAAGGGLTSNAVAPLVSPGPAPVLISTSPEFAAQGANRVQMTLVGSNFRPGATVVISSPLQNLNQLNGHT